MKQMGSGTLRSGDPNNLWSGVLTNTFMKSGRNISREGTASIIIPYLVYVMVNKLPAMMLLVYMVMLLVMVQWMKLKDLLQALDLKLVGNELELVH